MFPNLSKKKKNSMFPYTNNEKENLFHLNLGLSREIVVVVCVLINLILIKNLIFNLLVSEITLT